MLQTMLLDAATAQGGGGMRFIFMMVLLFVIMWFFMIRPQQKKQKEIQKFQNSLEVGQPVIVGGGIYGTVKFIDTEKNAIEVEIAKGVSIRVDKSAVFKDLSAMAGQPQKK